MTRSRFLLETVDSLPDLDLIKLGTMLRKHDILVGLEKTAEVGTRLVERENEIIAEFYKISAKIPPPGFFGGMKKAVGAVFDPKSAAKNYKALNKGATNEAAARASDTLGGRLGIAGDRVARTAKQNPLATGLAGGAAAGAAGYALGRDRQPNNVVIKTGAVLREGGRQFLRAMNPWAREQDYAASLDKIAAIGELNAKINLLLADESTRDDLKQEAIKLGQENHRHCIATLKKLASKKKDLLKTGGDLIGGAMGSTKAAAGSVANSFKGKPSSGGGFMSRVKDFFSGSGKSLGANIGDKATAAKAVGGISTSDVASGMKGATGATRP